MYIVYIVRRNRKRNLTFVSQIATVAGGRTLNSFQVIYVVC